MVSSNHENAAGSLAFPKRLWGKIVGFALRLKNLGKEDPRRIIHCFKVGLALTFVSLFYYFKPLYDGFGLDAMWAILTVVVVFEFSVGATLGKGLNRMLATLTAGALGIGAHRLATLSGETGEPILIALFVFIIAGIVTFLRFIPQLKARYDYGLMVFILTFCLISVSGYRDEEVIRMGFERLSTIVLGSCAAVFVCTFICPVWIGVDLHNHIATNIEKLGNFLEGFEDGYFKISEEGQPINKSSSLQGYKSVLTSSSKEEIMANLAKWEPCHGKFRFRHPWNEYLKVGSVTRQCAFKIESLNHYLTSEIQSPPEVRSIIQGECTVISSECGKALKELASGVRKMTKSSAAEPHITNSKAAAENLKAVIRSSLSKHCDYLEILQAGAVASLLFEVVKCTEEIAGAVHKLASLAHFKNAKPRVTPETQELPSQGAVNPVSGIDGAHHVITINPSQSLRESENSSPPVLAPRMEV
ncbi:aluminum-activated malate transporter 2-like [Pyrus x bretschneideri]|uniref:aluminum-activated malate transporter 2-like n=1 Tax=Pyrus x bretschneideri TaxID=225117 RepID=UPI002030A347|nr:aluminum-activated malate transporter 2-like [Pyrus x bretschneideri]